MRWVSSTGNGCTPGCVAREGIAALEPEHGGGTVLEPGQGPRRRREGPPADLGTGRALGCVRHHSHRGPEGDPRAHRVAASGRAGPEVAIPPPSERCARQAATIVGTGGARYIVGTSGPT